MSARVGGVTAGGRGDRGTSTLEYLGVVVVAAVLVTAVVTAVARADLGETIACELRSVVTQEGTCGGPDVPTTYDAGGADDGGVSAAAPRGSAGTKPGGSDPADGKDAVPADYTNAAGSRPPADAKATKTALGKLRDALDGGFWGVRGGDLQDAKDAVEGLNGAELDALVADMSDKEIKKWVDELDDGWLFGGWDREERRQLWDVFAAKASKVTLDRLAAQTDELQPAFDTIGGDSARKNKDSIANTAKYGEVNHRLFVGGAEATDIAQGGIGDCWFMASMMAVAESDPDLIEKAITTSPNGSYTVRLYDDGKRVDVVVTPEMVLDPNGDTALSYKGVGTLNGKPTEELWPLVMEKALAQQWGDYAAIEGDSPGLGLEVLTGKPSESGQLTDDKFSLEALAATLDGGGAVTLASFSKSDDNPAIYDKEAMAGGLPPDHAYDVQSVDVEKGTVTVVNPWGSRFPALSMSYADFRKNFRTIYSNEVS